ncbi:hypothetical protein Fmac_005878 [Flemingia macrophylla]|uniref:Transmembrane protein n=1 Tax=Flemingia macrophylla TaxID=520843 RepID=A0ABD1N909_9FABA
MVAKKFMDLYYEGGKLMKSHALHFHTLSLIFLFPLSFSIILSPTLNHLFNHLHTPDLHQQTTNPITLLYFLFLSLFAYSGVISITYSVFHFFYGQPITLLSSITSISTSFLPLLATTIVSQITFFFISLFYGLLLLLLISGAMLFGIAVPYSSSPYIIAFFVSLPLLLVMLHLQVKWTLVPVIVAVESRWGLDALRRSARLVKGMKRVALSSILFYGFFEGICVGNFFYIMMGYNGVKENWVTVVVRWTFTVTQSGLLGIFMLSNIAVTTLLYIYCKANHGEIAEEFEKDSVSLLLDDGKPSNIAV